MPQINWDSKLYNEKHRFVSDYGTEVVQLLAPKKGEHILDLGCGTGQLAAQISESDAFVLGTDASEKMIATAKRQYPNLKFECLDGTKLPYLEDFDAIFSNATFHWIDDQEALTKCLFNSLKKEGRLVVEFGGKGDVKSIIDAVTIAAQNLGLAEQLNKDFWFFPSISTYTTLLEKNGFEVEQAWLFDRPTALTGDNGMYDWITQFATHAFKKLDEAAIEEIKNLTVEILRPTHFINNQWMADYKRLRIKAFKR